MSKTIGALERRLGVMLFNRTTRRVVLTKQGQRYFDQIKPLIAELDEFDSALSSSTQNMSGPIRIAVSATFGRLHVLPLLSKLLDLIPGLQVDLVLSDNIRSMIDDRIDLAIRIGPFFDATAVMRRVAAVPLVCVGSRRYFDQHGVPEHPRDLVRHNCLVYTGMMESANWPFRDSDGEFSVAVSGNLSSNSIETVRAGVLSGIGIGFFTRASLAGELEDPDVIEVLKDFRAGARDINLVWPARHFVPARVRRVTEFFADALAMRI